MAWYFILLIGLALGVEAGRLSAGRPFHWKKALIALLVAAALAVGVSWWQKWDDSEGVYCTMEAKLCPDGSYVGRTGPKCEFSPCP